MRVWRGFALGLLVGLIVGAVFLGGYLLGTHSDAQAAGSADFATLWAVRDLLNRSFIGDPPTEQEQVFGATHGLVGSYEDPYTVFVEPARREVERDELRGEFGGIGAYLGRNEAGELIVTTMRDRPAARAGLQDGDILLAIDGVIVSPQATVEEVVALVRGPVGTEVKLTLRRPGKTDSFSVTVTREKFEVPSVEWRMLDVDNGIGYARIALFGERTAEELRTGLSELAGQGATKAVVDLRGNGGGLVDAAVEIASQFLSEGNVLREEKKGGQERFYPVKRTRGPAQEWELVLLVDGGTASASEIVAGALRDANRAILVGEKTYGKGSVQEVHELPDGSSLHVTVARWLTPNRNAIDQTGLQPDVQVGISEDDRNNGRDPQLTRAQAWLAGER
jgi:carboxyl-terminal processing protease